jgi:hypothetical protein
MHSRPKSLEGLRQELIEFMRGCEHLLGVGSANALTDDEAEIVRYYLQWLHEKYRR